MHNLLGNIVHQAYAGDALLQIVEDRTTRALHFDTGPVQSRMYLARPFELALSYTRHMMACLLFTERLGSVLQIGLGGGSLAKYVWRHFAEAQLEIVEQNETVPEVAHRFFALPRDERLTIRIAEGAAFMRGRAASAAPPYDLIMVDAFEARLMSSAVARQSFLNDCRACLAPDGVLAMNLWRGGADGYDTLLGPIQAAFDGRVLGLPVPDRANAIVFAFVDPPELSIRRLRERSAALSTRLDLEFAAFLRLLRRHNPVPGSDLHFTR